MNRSTRRRLPTNIPRPDGRPVSTEPLRIDGSNQTRRPAKGQLFGIDDPRSIATLFAAGAISTGAGVLVAAKTVGMAPQIALASVYLGVGVGILVIAVASLLLWSSLLGKPREVENMLRSMPWGGDENVLDVGCGQGLPLVLAARRLSGGHAVGVDLWRSKDLTGNTISSAQAHAAREGVEDRTALVKSDARYLPFVDGSFDVVLSSFTVHLLNARGRDMALREMTRVLKEGGRIAMLDSVHAKQYSKSFADKGLSDISVSRLRFRLFPPAHTVKARAPYKFATNRARLNPR